LAINAEDFGVLVVSLINVYFCRKIHIKYHRSDVIYESTDFQGNTVTKTADSAE
jgi:hypothetical protein